MASIKLKNVTKSYGETQVIPPLDLDIKDGEFVVLVGPSGCGKTTTLRMIAGLGTITSGELFIGERNVSDLRPGLRNCAMVFQSYALYPHMTVRENIGYGMKVRGVDKKTATKTVDDVAKTLNLTHYLDRKPSALSGGQRQRVAIGRAIVRDPDVFLFDEPLSNLDAKLRIEMRVEIKQLHRRLTTTMVYVTHDQVEAMTMADRVVVMRDGVIEQAADPVTLYQQPENMFVASFIGAPSMNMLDGKLIAADSGLTFATRAGFDIPVPTCYNGALMSYVNEEFVLGIRPEHAGEYSGEGLMVRMEIVDIEPLGSHTLVVGRVGENNFTAQFKPDTGVQPDDLIDVSLNEENLHFFRKSDEVAVRILR